MASVDKNKRPDGTYRARWREYPGGPQRTKHFARKVDAEQHLVKVQHDLMSGSYIDPGKARTTVRDYYTVWSERQPWRPSSRASLSSMFEGHVLPRFGDRPLGSIRRGDIESWGAGLTLGSRTAGLAMQYLTTMFESAVRDGLIASNPGHGAKRPRVESAPVVPFTLAELNALTSAAPEWFAVALTLGAACGLRQGEATGLAVGNVDFLRRVIVVERQLVTPSAGEPSFGPLKTKRSYRTVPLADVALERLAQHVERYGAGDGDVLLHEDGRPVRRQRFGKVWRGLRTRAGMPAARFHDARHTFASTLLSGGVSVAAAADYLGHSPGELLKTYAHLMPADHDRARSVVQAAFVSELAEASAE